MGEWSGQGIWWVLDYSFVLSLFSAAYGYEKSDRVVEENVLNPVVPTIDSLISTLTWVLDKDPEMAFIALDSGNSERKKIYEPYKAFRERAPEYHAAYEGCLYDIRDNFSDAVHVVAADGWEADDVMATVAKMATQAGKKCVMCSGDKDMRQLLRKGSVNMQIRARDELGKPTWRFFTAEEAEISWGGLRVDQFIDYQILLGDDVDNIPGAAGIGEKTAVKLLKQHDSIENMKVADIAGATGKVLKEFWKDEPMIRSLITLRDDVNIQNVEL